MPTHKSNDYKLTAVQYYLVEDKAHEEVCKIFKCTPRSLMRWVSQYKKEGNVIQKVISETPKEKYENIFKGAMKDQKNMFQRIKQEK